MFCIAILSVLLGKIYGGINDRSVGAIWIIAAKYINLMYERNMNLKEGVV